MKKLRLTSVALFMILNVVSCSEDDKPSKEEVFLADLSGSWEVETVSLDDEDVSDEFEAMNLTFDKDKTFSVQNAVGNIWPASGTFDLEPGTGDLFNLLRDDGTVVTINSLDDNTLTFTMQFDSAPGKTRGLAGEYTFEMKR